MARKAEHIPVQQKDRPRKDKIVDHFERAGGLLVKVRVGGQQKAMTARHAEALKLWTDALGGQRKAMAEVIRRDRQAERPLPKHHEQDWLVGPLVVYPPMTEEDFEAVYGGPQPQPTLPVLEEIRTELNESRDDKDKV